MKRDDGTEPCAGPALSGYTNKEVEGGGGGVSGASVVLIHFIGPFATCLIHARLKT